MQLKTSLNLDGGFMEGYIKGSILQEYDIELKKNIDNKIDKKNLQKTKKKLIN